MKRLRIRAGAGGVAPRAARVVVAALTLLTAAAAAGALAVPAAAAETPPRPKIVKKYIAFGQSRKEQAADYSEKRYHQHTWVLEPRAIVLHHTAGSTWESAWYTFNGNAAYLGEKPGVSAHFIIDKDGTIYQCMPLSIRGRHCVGMNWVSIGIEFVQEMQSGKDGHWMDRQILARTKQAEAGLKLVRYLRVRFHIKKTDIYGHATANGSHFFKDYTGQKNAAGDWFNAEVRAFRRRL